VKTFYNIDNLTVGTFAFGTLRFGAVTLRAFFQGYCFIEYANLQSCLDAISSMNLFDLGSIL
jgi:hypothetical protein